jgi:hypothetical protein
MKVLTLVLCALMALPVQSLAQVAGADKAPKPATPATLGSAPSTQPVATQGQTSPRQPSVGRGQTFLNQAVKSAAEYADIIETCKTRDQIAKGQTSARLNLSCEALIEGFNASPAFDDLEIGDVENVKELADYIRTLEWVPCQQRQEPVSIARVVNDKVDYSYKRPCRPDEFWLFDRNANLMISSMVCGQFFGDKISIFAGEPTDTSVDRRRTLADQAADEATKQQAQSRRDDDDSRRRGLSTGTKVAIGGLVGGVLITGLWCAAVKCFKITTTAEAEVHTR